MLHRMARSPWLVLLLPLLTACVGPKSKECMRLVGVASEASQAVDPKSIESVQKNLDAVDAAHKACQEAGRDEETAQLAKGQRDLRAHLERLQKKAADPARKPLSEAELAELVAKGDPGCPKGQGYKRAGKDVRCTGPQLVDLGYAAAREYFERRGYKLKDVEPSSLEVEHGAERLVFEYERPKDDQPPRCLRIQPPPEQSWQEAVARATGAPPNRLEPGGKVPAQRGKLAIGVESDSAAGAVRLGDCGR